MSSTGSPLLTDLIDALRCLPGVGAKTAQRMAFHLLERDRTGGRRLAERLAVAIERIGNCTRCRTFSEETVCALCASTARERSLLCVVETPVDQLAIEQATGFRGQYFVLLGRLSPLDGLGPKELGLDLLARRLGEGEVRELIIATNPTVEGEATAHMLAQIARTAGVRASRLAHGVPLGGELEFIDRGTLAHAFGGRQAFA
ncbi:MAG: recombination mediator RecR [Rhodanobacter sp.]|jgi:recombination protein RecR|nr:recombination mediator RecR [Rhodanobacter sp.]